jgi:hypothetical protein
MTAEAAMRAKPQLAGIPKTRLATHGPFADSARLCQRIKGALASDPKFATLSEEHREALQMIAFKMSRIVAGDPDYPDHWNDIAGYAHLGHVACKQRGGHAR